MSDDQLIRRMAFAQLLGLAAYIYLPEDWSFFLGMLGLLFILFAFGLWLAMSTAEAMSEDFKRWFDDE